AAVRERFGLARDETLQVRDFPTLTHVVGWVRDKTGSRDTATVQRAADDPIQAAAPIAAGPAGDEIAGAVVGIVSELTGYPPDLLDVDLDLEADL
ncbi:hypothetical protein, partial [Actinoplanes awajinensis]|uniref:hypothetical protein n=1 Tax=Actinoplanes awajinensis TaxID=135946 RepID=UPI0018DAFC86